MEIGLITFREICPLDCSHIVPSQTVPYPSHVPLDWHFRTEEPRRINPGSQLNETIFGYTVRLPDIEPFMGDDRPPQFTATRSNCNSYLNYVKNLTRAVACNQSHSRQTSMYLHRNFRFHSNSQLKDIVLFSILAE